MLRRDAVPADPPVPPSPGASPDQGSPEDATLVGRILSLGLRVLERLGSTPEGTLYRAEYPSGVEAALLHLCPRTGGAPPLGRERLDQAVQIRHPNVAAIYEVGEMGDGSLYVVLEQLFGEPLSDVLTADRVFALPDALDLALQAAAGLQAAHRAGFVHGNLSPDTILVTPAAGGRGRVKLIRFTLDRALGPGGVAPPVYGEASARYASPERLDGQPPDERSDVFSLGAVLHHLLTGMPPYPGNVDRSVPRVARPVLASALAPDPARRFQTITEFEAALERVVAVAGGPRPKIRRAVVLGAVGAGVALAAGIFLLPGTRWPEASEERPVPAVPAPTTAREAPPAPAPPRSPPPAPAAPRRDAPPGRNSPADNAPSRASAPANPEPQAARPRPAATAVGDRDTDRSIETGMVMTPPVEEPPPTIEERAQVYLRIGLDEARRQLGRPVHAIEGMTPLFVGLAPSGFPPYPDTTRLVVRAVYMGPNESLILLDQQRIRRGERLPGVAPTTWRIGDVLLHLHGEARPEVLRNLVRRVR